jgi:sec-independent protein translocase protein TatB
MFNLSGSEIVFLLLIALIVLGPEKLPEAVRKFGKTYAEFKKMTTGFQSELKSALDEPMREMRETAEAFKKAANFDFNDDPETTVADEPAAAAPPLSSVIPDPPVDESPIADSDRPPGPTFTSAAPRQPDTVDATDAVEESASE